MTVPDITALIVAIGSGTTPACGVVVFWLFARDRQHHRNALRGACVTCAPQIRELTTPKPTAMLVLIGCAYAAGFLCLPSVRSQIAQMIPSAVAEPALDCKCATADRTPPDVSPVKPYHVPLRKKRQPATVASIPMSGDPWGWWVEPLQTFPLRVMD